MVKIEFEGTSTENLIRQIRKFVELIEQKGGKPSGGSTKKGGAADRDGNDQRD